MDKDDFVNKYKRCPECLAKMPLSATKCPSCNQKLGEPDKHGLARKPFNWSAYLTTIILWIALIYFIWWGFFK